MASMNLGKVAIIPKGTWNNSTAYEKLNLVTYTGNSYIAKTTVPAGTALTNENYWQLMAESSVANATNIIAEAFATNKNYAIGEYVVYQGNLYEFTSAHAAGAWNSSHVQQITIGDALESKSDADHTHAYYVRGTQTTSTSAWTGVLSEVNSLRNGIAIDYWLPYNSTSTAATLNLTLGNGQTTGAVAVYNTSLTRFTTHVGAFAIIRLVYQENVNISGTNYTGWWRIYDAKPEAVPGFQTYDRYLADSTTYRYQLLFQKSEYVLTPLNNANDTGTSKTMLTNVEFDPFGKVFFYNSTNAVNANAKYSSASLLYAYSVIDLRYILNCGSTLTADADVFLKLIPQSNGMVKIATGTCWVQTLPSTNDGYWYMLLGRAYDSYRISVPIDHPIYYHDGTSLRTASKEDLATTSSKGLMSPADKTKLDALQPSAYALASSYPNDADQIKTKFRVSGKNTTGSDSTAWYFPLVRFPKSNTSNYTSLIVRGRIGGWGSSNMNFFQALFWNRDGTGIANINISGTATNEAAFFNRCDFVVYKDSTTEEETVYIRTTGYYVYDIDLELYQNTASIIYDGTHLTTEPSGTKTAQASTSPRRLTFRDGKLMVAGTEAKLTDTHNTYFVEGTQTVQTGSWTGNLPDVDALYDGMAIDYWLPQYGSGNATLNLTLGNGSTTTGAINVYNNGTTRMSTQVGANNMIRLVYRSNMNISGTNYTGWWRIFDSSPNTATNLQLAITAFKAKSATYRYQLLFQVDADYLTPLNNNDTTNTTKTMLTNVEFDPFGQIYYFSANTSITANSVYSSSYLYNVMGLLDARYTFNCGQTLESNKDFYLKVIPQDSGKVKLATGTCWATELPNTDDGYWYIYLGRVSGNNYQIALFPHHPVYYHDGTSVREIVGHHHDERYYTQEQIDAKRWVYYVRGTQSASTNAFTGNLPEISELYNGLTIDYWLPYPGTSTAATLNLTINGGTTTTGAIAVYNNGTTRFTTNVAQYNLMRLIYQTDVNINGTNYTGWWRIYDANPSSVCYFYNQENWLAKSAVYRYQLLFETSDGLLTPLNNADNTVGTSKTMLTNVEINPFGKIFYYNTTTSKAANEQVGGGALYYAMGTIDLRYTLNTGTTLTARQDVYLKTVPVPNSNRMVNLATGTCWTQTLPSSNDGYWYIKLGRAYDNYRITLFPDHPVYRHDGTAVREVPRHLCSPEDITSGYLENRVYLNTHSENSGVIVPFINNDLAFIWKRGGSYRSYKTTSETYTSNTLVESETLNLGLYATMNGSGDYCNVTCAQTDKIVLELTLPALSTYENVFYIDFGEVSFRAKNITILVRNMTLDTDWTKKGWTTNNERGHFWCNFSYESTDSGNNIVKGFDQVRIVLTDWYSSSSSGKRIAQIGSIRWNSEGIRNIAMSRGADDDVYRNIHPFASGTYSLGTSDKKWNYVYANNINTGTLNGVTVPATPVFTDTDTKVTNTLATTTKYYLTGTTSSSTNTGTQSFDSGIYATTTAGQLNATTYKVNEHVTLQYNSTDESLDFVFS